MNERKPLHRATAAARRATALLSTFAVVAAFGGCALKKQLVPDEQPSESAPADSSTAPYFMLSDLPSIDGYSKKYPYDRLYDKYTVDFKPSADYGGLLLYFGDTNMYTAKDATDIKEVYSHCGLMTVDGKVVTDPVYNYSYTQELDNGKSIIVMMRNQSDNEGDNFVQHLTVVSEDGTWAIELSDYFLVSCTDDRILFTNYNESIICYDYNGKQVFKLEESVLASSFENGIFVCVKNADEETQEYLCFDKDGKQLSFPSLTMCTSFINGYAEAETESGEGIISASGEWLFQPIYKEAYSIEGKYFIVYDGTDAKICDKDGKEIKTISNEEMLRRNYRVNADRLIYSVNNGNGSGGWNSLYFNALTDEPIACEGNKFQAQYDMAEIGLFFSMDSEGNGRLFDYDGKVVNSFKNLYDPPTWGSGFYSVTVGEPDSFQEHIYLADNHKKVLEIDSNISCYHGYWFAESGKLDYIIASHYPQDTSESEDIARYSIFSVEKGEYLFENCLDAQIQYVGGHSYFRVAYEEYTAVYDENMKMLIRVTNQYYD